MAAWLKTSIIHILVFFSDDVKRVSFKDEQGQNKYCYMFLKQMILQQKEKYRYAYKFNGDRMARQKIMMPVDELGDIDFKFMNKLKLGKLEEVDIRELWKHEQYDFSEWLSKEENIEMLSDEIGLTLTEINKEVFVGSYRCDLVAKDETTGIKVIIENQLEATNHDHLGKIITYASGLDANVVIWIVKEAREEHRSAIEWLNNKTTKDISFFLMEIRAYKIGDSLPAPKFVVIEKPNDFVKTANAGMDSGELSKAQAARLNFWNRFNEVLILRNKPFNARKATTDHWYDVALGTSEAHISITLVNKINSIGIEIYINDNKELFDRLYSASEEIQNELGFSMDWQRLDNKKASRIIYYISGLDFDNHENYNELVNEVIDRVIDIRNAFRNRL